MNWVKFTEEFPPKFVNIIIAMRNKNMGEEGIWLYDVCTYTGGDITDDDNFNVKENWETPIYWCCINEPL